MTSKDLKLVNLVPEGKIKNNELMSRHTTFRIGGPADVFVEVNNSDILIKVIGLARKENTPFFILGGGSNILVGDKGIRGLVIHYKSGEYWLRNNELEVSAGAGTAKIAMEMIQKGLSTGLEHFATVPGTIGGAVYNNSHWKDKLIGDYLLKAKILTPNDEVEEVSQNYFNFRYDYSVLQDTDDVLLTTFFKAEPAPRAMMEQMVVENNKVRTNQPLNEKCAGCTFKNPSKEQPAGLLIDQCGLKGRRIGGAQISTKHANFIINTGAATAIEVIGLIELCKKEVQKKTGVELEEEIFRIGEF